jgi:disulfide oxidoreductase YuzD
MFFQMRYGDAVRVSHVELADAANRDRFSDLVALAEERDLTYPLVAIDGQVRMAGSAHYYHILPYVEEVLASEIQAVEGAAGE